MIIADLLQVKHSSPDMLQCRRVIEAYLQVVFFKLLFHPCVHQVCQLRITYWIIQLQYNILHVASHVEYVPFDAIYLNVIAIHNLFEIECLLEVIYVIFNWYSHLQSRGLHKVITLTGLGIIHLNFQSKRERIRLINDNDRVTLLFYEIRIRFERQ